MLDIQLGRRNLSPIQRIAVAEKYRPIYEKQALINKQNAINEARKNNKNNKNEQFLVNLPKTVPINTSEKLASVAGVSEKTYRMGAKILNSDNEEVKEKFKNTCLEKYGVENPTLNPEIRAKQIEVCVEKYGAISSLGNAEIREKGKKTMLELYGYESAGSCPELMAKAAETRKKNGNGVTTSS